MMIRFIHRKCVSSTCTNLPVFSSLSKFRLLSSKDTSNCGNEPTAKDKSINQQSADNELIAKTNLNDTAVNPDVLKTQKGIKERPPLREDWLPAERPWEEPLPLSEQYQPINKEPYLYLSSTNPRVTDEQDEKMAERVGLDTYYRFKYPQFKVHENPLEYFRLPKDYKKAAFERAGLKSNFQHLPDEYITPDHSEITIIGGGMVGTMIAYMIKYMTRDTLPVMVIEKDLSYANANWHFDHGGFRTQFSLPENIQCAHFFHEFLKSNRTHLSILDLEPPDINYTPAGFLFLTDLENAEKKLEQHQRQVDYGSYVDILNDFQLAQRFPWLDTEGVALGTHGVEGEGWLDPRALFAAIRGRAEFLGVRFYEAEFVDWNNEYLLQGDNLKNTDPGFSICNQLIYRLPCGAEKNLSFARCIVAAGPDSGQIARQLGLGRPNSGMRTVPLPVEKRKRYNFIFNCPDAPIVDFPFLVDEPSGVWVRRDGLGGNFICGKNPTEEEEPNPSDLSIDYSFFEKLIWPTLVKRVPAFARLQIVHASASYVDYNYFDQTPVVGEHPMFPQIYFASGFSGYAMQTAPAVGRAIAEEILHTEQLELNLTRYNWNRLLLAKPLREEMIV